MRLQAYELKTPVLVPFLELNRQVEVMTVIESYRLVRISTIRSLAFEINVISNQTKECSVSDTFKGIHWSCLEAVTSLPVSLQPIDKAGESFSFIPLNHFQYPG